MGDTMKKTLLTLAAASALSVSAQAEQYWADNSVSLLYSNMYAEPFAGDENTYSTITLEHVSGHSWGGLFYFVDKHSGSDLNGTYLEISPKYTLAKMEGTVSAVNLAYTLESGGATDNHLFGAGVDLTVPGMDYFGVTYYRAMNDGQDVDDNQITVVYGYSNGNFTIDGFMDYSFGAEDNGSEDNMHLNPQITYNIAPMLGLKSKLKVGVEYSYWGSDKYGVKNGGEQNSVSLLLKAHL
jgi:nucleoside-specific outer membrane channel protein Tsx